MPDKWESQRDNIRRLYVDDDLTCKQLVVEMKRLYGFEANEKEYQRRVRKWGLRKGLKKEEWNFVGRRIAKRKAEEGKDSELIVNGNAFPQHKIRKALGRHYFETMYDHFQREMAVGRSQTPEGLFITTPPRQRSLTPVNRSATISVDNLPYFDFLRVLERHAEKFKFLASSEKKILLLSP
ncbi:hypothetical protein SLS55_006460 [Diplodia seriata]|uniref:Clr5 domain-containing protein n=1 Tax=Diplodia seriata TaxID=420778 RepID=A0ABR3CE94_9PEZI